MAATKELTGRLSCRVSPEEKARVGEWAEASGCTEAELVRRAVSYYLDALGGRYDLAAPALARLGQVQGSLDSQGAAIGRILESQGRVEELVERVCSAAMASLGAE